MKYLKSNPLSRKELFMGRLVRLGLVVVGLLIAGVLICNIFIKKSPMNEKATAPTIEVTSDLMEEWREYKPQSQLFTVSLPALPQHASQAIPVQEGEGVIRYNMYLAQARDGATFMINVIEYPASFDVSDSQALLEGVMKEIVGGNPNNTLVKSTRDAFYGFPSLLFLVHNQEGTIKTRVIQKNHVLYVLSAADISDERVESKFEKLVGSFKFH